MMTRFQKMCTELNLPTSYQQESDVDTLVAWCHDNISQDIRYEGSLSEKYNHYLRFAENYLDVFIENLPSNLAEPVVAYNHLGAIHYAANQGYNHFIASVPKLSPEVVNEADNYGMTPLHKAAIQGHLFTIEALLNHGANVNLLNAQGESPIYSAFFIPILHNKNLVENKEKIIRKLLPLTPLALTSSDIAGNTLLHLASTHSFDNLIPLLIESNPQLPFIQNNALVYPVQTAILNNQYKAMALLLAIEGGALLKDGKQCLPLHYAARYGTKEMVEVCCQVTPNINERDSLGKTPLLWAAYVKNQEAVMILLQHGADPTLVDYEGFSISNMPPNK